MRSARKISDLLGVLNQRLCGRQIQPEIVHVLPGRGFPLPLLLGGRRGVVLIREGRACPSCPRKGIQNIRLASLRFSQTFLGRPKHVIDGEEFVIWTENIF